MNDVVVYCIVIEGTEQNYCQFSASVRWGFVERFVIVFIMFSIFFSIKTFLFHISFSFPSLGLPLPKYKYYFFSYCIMFKDKSIGNIFFLIRMPNFLLSFYIFGFEPKIIPKLFLNAKGIALKLEELIKIFVDFLLHHKAK